MTALPASRERKPGKAAIHIADQMAAMIRSGEYAVGQALPAERDLAEAFGVSRLTLREALTALQMVGSIETRPGLGSFISSQVRPDLRSDIWSLGPSESVGEVLEVRQVIEPAAAFLAAGRLTPSAREHLQDLLEKMRVADAELHTFGGLDLQFHRVVAEASGNRVLTRIVSALLSYANQRLWVSIRAKAYGNEQDIAGIYFRQHQATMAALVAGDREGARKAMLDHLENTERIWYRSGGLSSPASPASPSDGAESDVSRVDSHAPTSEND